MNVSFVFLTSISYSVNFGCLIIVCVRQRVWAREMRNCMYVEKDGTEYSEQSWTEKLLSNESSLRDNNSASRM